MLNACNIISKTIHTLLYLFSYALLQIEDLYGMYQKYFLLTYLLLYSNSLTDYAQTAVGSLDIFLIFLKIRRSEDRER